MGLLPSDLCTVRAWAESQSQCPLHCCWGTNRSKSSPTCPAHLPAHDLFSADGLAPPPRCSVSDLTWNSVSNDTHRCVCVTLPLQADPLFPTPFSRRLSHTDHIALRPGHDLDHWYCFMSTEARLLIRDGKRVREWRLNRGYLLKKTGETVDRRQNNAGSVKAVSPRHCAVATSAALRNCCFNCRAGQSHKDNWCPLHCCWGTTRSERSPTFSAAPPPCSWSLLG